MAQSSLIKSAILCGLIYCCMPVDRARADFVGELSLTPAGCESSGRCRLAEEFGFVDQAGTGWVAKKGLLTDGASIPPWAKPFVGDSFDAAFIKAAVIHDHYCDRRVRPWRQTHRVFYDALLSSGVSPGRAGIMYFAILIGGPKWVDLIKGIPCPVGQNCINAIDVSSEVAGGSIAMGDTAKSLLIVRENRFGSASFANTLRLSVPKLEEAGDNLAAADVEELAATIMSDDFFFRNPPRIGTTLDIKLQ